MILSAGWASRSTCMVSLLTIPASPFLKHDSNGLWEYSPLLCAAGLVNGIIFMQQAIMRLWSGIPELTLVLHLHNILVKREYLKKEVKLYAVLETLCKISFFPKGIVKDIFSDVLTAQIVLGRNNTSSLRQRQAVSRHSTKDIYQLLDPGLNRCSRPNQGS
jgi:hypothetical protein